MDQAGGSRRGRDPRDCGSEPPGGAVGPDQTRVLRGVSTRRPRVRSITAAAEIAPAEKPLVRIGQGARVRRALFSRLLLQRQGGVDLSVRRGDEVSVLESRLELLVVRIEESRPAEHSHGENMRVIRTQGRVRIELLCFRLDRLTVQLPDASGGHPLAQPAFCALIPSEFLPLPATCHEAAAPLHPREEPIRNRMPRFREEFAGDVGIEHRTHASEFEGAFRFFEEEPAVAVRGAADIPFLVEPERMDACLRAAPLEVEDAHLVGS